MNKDYTYLNVPSRQYEALKKDVQDLRIWGSNAYDVSSRYDITHLMERPFLLLNKGDDTEQMILIR